MSSPPYRPERTNFEPEQSVKLKSPKDDLITYEELAKCDGTNQSPVYPD